MIGKDTPATVAEAPVCFVCGKEIVDGHWFARIRQGSRRVIFCRPFCVEKFLLPPEKAFQEGWPTPDHWLNP